MPKYSIHFGGRRLKIQGLGDKRAAHSSVVVAEMVPQRAHAARKMHLAVECITALHSLINQ
jgi:hypothetical protein